MHPKNWLTPDDEDSIAKAHQRLNALFEKHLAETDPNSEPAATQATMIAAIHHRMLWWETYITRGALDEQISDRVRYEAAHFWRALDEATLKLNANAEFCERIDKKLKALDAAIELLDYQKHVMNDAIPAEYKLRFRQLASAIKQALAA